MIQTFDRVCFPFFVAGEGVTTIDAVDCFPRACPLMENADLIFFTISETSRVARGELAQAAPGLKAAGFCQPGRGYRSAIRCVGEDEGTALPRFAAGGRWPRQLGLRMTGGTWGGS